MPVAVPSADTPHVPTMITEPFDPLEVADCGEISTDASFADAHAENAKNAPARRIFVIGLRVRPFFVIGDGFGYGVRFHFTISVRFCQNGPFSAISTEGSCKAFG